MIAADEYPDYDQFSIYGSAAAVAQPLPAGADLTADRAVTVARRAIFRGFLATDECLRRRYQGSMDASSPYVEGWQQTLEIVSANRTFSST